MKRRELSTLLLILFAGVFIISACAVWRTVTRAEEEKAAFADLAEIAAEASAAPEVADPSQEQTVSSDEPSPYAALKERNPDFFGWLSIEGTELNYPVMHTPEDPEYYLRRDFDGKKSQSGVPFLSAPCHEGCGNYLIYGHNMKNGSMFASLLSYADIEYWRQHPTIQFDTLDASDEYEVAAAFYSEAYPQDAVGVFRFYQYTDVSDRAVFGEYMDQVRRAALYETGVSAEYGDQFITLTTCSYHTKNGRFVVVARKAAP